jgi:hypothetical protein
MNMKVGVMCFRVQNLPSSKLMVLLAGDCRLERLREQLVIPDTTQQS